VQVAEAAQQRLQHEARGTDEQNESDARWRERMEVAVSDALVEAELDDRRVTQVREISCRCECTQALLREPVRQPMEAGSEGVQRLL
jgi:hypothetical protein